MKLILRNVGMFLLPATVGLILSSFVFRTTVSSRVPTYVHHSLRLKVFIVNSHVTTR
jgi:hypothetical protein